MVRPKIRGLNVDWEYNKGQVDMSMPNYVIDALNRLQHTQQQPQYSPHVNLTNMYTSLYTIAIINSLLNVILTYEVSAAQWMVTPITL